MDYNACRDLCDCDECMPPGADGATDDALDAALRTAKARTGLRGAYYVRGTARGLAIAWTSDAGNRTDLERDALREAAHALRRVGREAPLAPGARELYLAA